VTVVTNAGPLMALGKLGVVHLLYALYGQVLVPEEVYHEVVHRGLVLGQPDAHAVQLAVARNELALIALDNVDPLENALAFSLDAGERHAIRVGLQVQADWVLLDDLLAREEAQRLGLRVKGTLGILVDACRKGLLSVEETELVFQAILDREDIWISGALVRRVQARLAGFDREELDDE
jgi:predicted nucleic acid-binding protein